MNRAEAAAAVDEVCPRCGAPRDRSQAYCLECGFQLPPLRGRMPGWRRRWLRRLGWYPGDWVWISALTFLVAAAGAAVSIAATSGGGSGNGSTIVAPPPPATTTAPPPPPPTTTHRTTDAHTTTAHTTTTKTPPPPPPPTTTAPANGSYTWPAGQNGWTNVLESFPTSGGIGAAQAAAGRAARRGLPQVGVLDSSQFASLHPGYYVVFSGVYASSAEADAALASAHAGGFAGAYSRQIAR